MTEECVQVQVVERIGVLWKDRYWEATDGVFEMPRSVAEGYARNGSLTIVETAVQPPPAESRPQLIADVTNERAAALLAKAGYATVDDLAGVDLDTLLNVKYLAKRVARELHARFANRSVD